MGTAPNKRQTLTDHSSFRFLTSQQVRWLRGSLPPLHLGPQLMARHFPGQVFLGIFCQLSSSDPLVLGSLAHHLCSLAKSAQSNPQSPCSSQGKKNALSTRYPSQKGTGTAHWDRPIKLVCTVQNCICFPPSWRVRTKCVSQEQDQVLGCLAQRTHACANVPSP